jgi:hypothetical protein
MGRADFIQPSPLSKVETRRQASLRTPSNVPDPCLGRTRTPSFLFFFVLVCQSAKSMSCNLAVLGPHRMYHGTRGRWKPGYRDRASSHRIHCRRMARPRGWRSITVAQAQRRSLRLSLAQGMPCALSLGSSLDAIADVVQHEKSSRLMATSSGYVNRFEFLFDSVQQARQHGHVLCPNSVTRCTDVHQGMSIMCTLARCDVSRRRTRNGVGPNFTVKPAT